MLTIADPAVDLVLDAAIPGSLAVGGEVLRWLDGVQKAPLKSFCAAQPDRLTSSLNAEEAG
jgi:hypothetical protein